MKGFFWPGYQVTWLWDYDYSEFILEHLLCWFMTHSDVISLFRFKEPLECGSIVLNDTSCDAKYVIEDLADSVGPNDTFILVIN